MKLGFCSASNQPFPYPLFETQPLRPPSSSIAITETIAIFHQLLRSARSAILSSSQQEFHIAFGPGDRARHNPQHGPTLRFNPAFGLGADPVVHGRVANNAALPDFL